MVSSSYFYSVAQKKHFKCGRKEEEDTYAEVSCFPNPAFHSQIMSQNPAYGCPLDSRQDKLLGINLPEKFMAVVTTEI